MNIMTLKSQIPVPYFDYQRLKVALQDHSHERRVIGQFIKKGYLIRVKKGLYTWGAALSSSPYSKEVLANLIFGPSYVSLEYALSYHGLIPERVETLTSVTTKRAKQFETPVGLFTYDHLHEKTYPWGFQLVRLNRETSFYIASPEKAVLDTLSLRVKAQDVSGNNFFELLHEDLRIDQMALKSLDHKKVHELSSYYLGPVVRSFAKFMTSNQDRIYG